MCSHVSRVRCVSSGTTSHSDHLDFPTRTTFQAWSLDNVQAAIERYGLPRDTRVTPSAHITTALPAGLDCLPQVALFPSPHAMLRAVAARLLRDIQRLRFVHAGWRLPQRAARVLCHVRQGQVSGRVCEGVAVAQCPLTQVDADIDGPRTGRVAALEVFFLLLLFCRGDISDKISTAFQVRCPGCAPVVAWARPWLAARLNRVSSTRCVHGPHSFSTKRSTGIAPRQT